MRLVPTQLESRGRCILQGTMPDPLDHSAFHSCSVPELTFCCSLLVVLDSLLLGCLHLLLVALATRLELRAIFVFGMEVEERRACQTSFVGVKGVSDDAWTSVIPTHSALNVCCMIRLKVVVVEVASFKGAMELS